jgi:hypothetical protein
MYFTFSEPEITEIVYHKVRFTVRLDILRKVPKFQEQSSSRGSKVTFVTITVNACDHQSS